MNCWVLYLRRERVFVCNRLPEWVSAKPTRYTQSSIKRIHFVVASNTSCIHFVRIHLWLFFRFSFTLWLSLRKQKLIVEPVLIPCTHRVSQKGYLQLMEICMYVGKGGLFCLTTYRVYQNQVLSGVYLASYLSLNFFNRIMCVCVCVLVYVCMLFWHSYLFGSLGLLGVSGLGRL